MDALATFADLFGGMLLLSLILVAALKCTTTLKPNIWPERRVRPVYVLARDPYAADLH